jgi:alkylation response protein AidB-like acyl-CoA dehydrogenase
MTAFSLDSDQIAVRDMARSFADEKLAPHALEWDEKKIFPVDVIREAAALGMAAIYLREDVGGSGMTRFDAALIFEEHSTGCPSIAAYVSIHNMCAWMIDVTLCVLGGSQRQKSRWTPVKVKLLRPPRQSRGNS